MKKSVTCILALMLAMSITSSLASNTIYSRSNQSAKSGKTFLSSLSSTGITHTDHQTGYVDDYHSNDESANSHVSQPLVTRQEAQRIAIDYVSKVNPLMANSMAESPSYINYFSPNLYILDFNHIYNGHILINDSACVMVDYNSGKIQQFESTWHNVKISPQKVTGTKEMALETYRKTCDMKLCYRYFNGKYIPAYMPVFNNGMVATDGRSIIGSYGKPVAVANNKFKDISVSEKNKIYQDYKASRKNKLSKLEDDKKIAENYIKKYYKEKYLFSNTKERNRGTFSTWQISYINSKNTQNQIVFEFRQDNGQLYIFNKFGSGIKINNKPVIPWSQAYSEAISAIEAICPEWINDIETKKKEGYTDGLLGDIFFTHIPTIPLYDFTFHRQYKGIPLDSDGISINIDGHTGELLSMSAEWRDNLPISTSKDIITSDKAKDIYFSRLVPELQYYIPTNTNSSTTNPKLKSDNTEAIEAYGLRYRLNNTLYDSFPISFIGAADGNLYDNLGLVISDNNLFTDAIKSSPAKRQIQIFSDMGLLAGKDFMPDQPITKSDAITLLMQLKCSGNKHQLYRNSYNGDVFYTDISRNDSTYYYISAAIKLGIIINKKAKFLPNEPLTKQELASWLVNAMDSNSLPNINQSIVTNLNKENDEANNYKACVSIFNLLQLNLNGKNITDADAAQNATWEDMIYALYNSMKYMNTI